MITLTTRFDVNCFLSVATPRQLTAALLAVYRNQTADERICQSTIYRNRRGFNASDGSKGSKLQYMAQWCIGNGTVDKPQRCLSGDKWCRMARAKLRKYWRQLVAANRAKRAALAMAKGNSSAAVSALQLG